MPSGSGAFLPGSYFNVATLPCVVATLNCTSLLLVRSTSVGVPPGRVRVTVNTDRSVMGRSRSSSLS